jgi:hypothetical protein
MLFLGLAAFLAVLAIGEEAYAPSHPVAAPFIVNVTLNEWNVLVEQQEIPAGKVSFLITNSGTMAHALKIGGLSIGTSETEVFGPGITRTLNVDLPAGEFELWCPIGGHRGLGMETQISVTGDTPPPAGGPPPTPPPSSEPPRSIRDFDRDGDCRIGDIEFFGAVDRWISEQIGDILFFQIVDAWISEASVCATSVISADGKAISTLMANPNSLSFSVQGSDSAGFVVDVFSTSGQLVFSGRSIKAELSWNLRNNIGRPVANGVYFYRVQMLKVNGQGFGRSEIRPLMILRQ